MSPLSGILGWIRRASLSVKDMIFPRKCIFSDQDISDYITLTFLSVEQIFRAYYKFLEFGAEFTEDDKNPCIGHDVILNSHELKRNPFKDRMIKVFSDSEEFMSFEEYLNMVSIFSEKAPLKVKAVYAFKIYDFNEDNLLCTDDIEEMIKRIKGDNPLKPWIFNKSNDIIMSEMDIDADGFINLSEFEHSLSKLTDFFHSFKFRI